MDAVDEDRFTELVENALDELPDAFWDRLDNVAILISDVHTEETDLLGLYEGVPTTERWDYAGVLPDTITLYRLPLCEMCADEAELIAEIRVTVVHEVAHHFGIEEDELHELGWG